MNIYSSRRQENEHHCKTGNGEYVVHVFEEGCGASLLEKGRTEIRQKNRHQGLKLSELFRGGKIILV